MRTLELLFNLLFVFGPVAAVLMLALVVGATMQPVLFWGYLTLGLYAVGLGLFLAAKISILRRGKVFFGFGTKQMSPRFRTCYRLGYLLMGAGAVLTLILAAR